MNMDRRQFLGLGAGAAAVAGGAARLAWSLRLADHVEDAMPPGSTSTTAATSTTTGETTTVPALEPEGEVGTGEAVSSPLVSDRVLVVIQLAGGNDGLNTLVPHDGRYFDARPGLRVPENEMVALRGQSRYGLNPNLRDLVPLWDAGRLAAVDALGFPDQSRSHFAAMDTWWRGTADRAVRSGWLGRWLDGAADDNPLRAVALGGGSPALVGDRRGATVVLDPKGFSLRTPKGADAKAVTAAFRATAAPLDPEPTKAAAQRAVPASVSAVEALAAAKAVGEADDDGSGPEGKVTSLLGTAAGIIDLKHGARVILVAADGFDTHTDQARRHGPLLADLATGIRRFTDTLAARGQADRVMVMTTSEFGRRVKENGSGTDHGNGGVQFLAGGGLARSQVVGDADLARLADGDLRATIDTRSLYAAALDWLDGDPGATDRVLGGSFDRFGLTSA